jgi:hypothetical protein
MEVPQQFTPQLRQALQVGHEGLVHQLQALDRGEVPSPGELRRVFTQMASEGRILGQPRIDRIASGLADLFQDMEEDGLELALEDFDLLLESGQQLLDLIAGGSAEHQVVLCEAELRPTRAIAPDALDCAPHFLPAGLRMEQKRGEVHLSAPRDAHLQEELIEADLLKVWEETPMERPLVLDLRSLDRVPLIFLTTLIRLQQAADPSPRAVLLRLHGAETLSSSLRRSLTRHFLIS